MVRGFSLGLEVPGIQGALINGFGNGDEEIQRRNLERGSFCAFTSHDSQIE